MVLRQTGIKVKLIEEDGNAFYILSKVCTALRSHKISEAFIQEFLKEATSDDYHHLLGTVMQVVEVR